MTSAKFLISLLLFFVFITNILSAQDTSDLQIKLDSSRKILEQDPYASLTLAQEVLKTAQASGNLMLKAEAQLRIGIYHLQQSNYAQALNFFIESQNIATKLQNQNLLARVLMNIGNVYYELSQYTTAVSNLQKATTLAQKLEDETILAGCLINMGNVQTNMGNYKDALEAYQKALKIHVKVQDKKGIAITLSNIGNIYFYQKNFEAAEDYYKKALKIKQELLDIQGMVIALQNLGNLYLQLKDLEKAKQFSIESLELATLLKSKDDKQRASNNLYAIYKRQGDYKKALAYLEYSNLLKDSIQGDAQAKELGRLEAKFELDKQETEINLLKKDRALKEEKSKQDLLYKNIIIVIILLFTALILTIAIFINNRKIKRINQRLLKQNKEIAQKNEALQILNEEIDQFVYRSSHDLKAPLTSVLGLINIAKLEGSTPIMQNYFEKMQVSIDKLMLVLQDLSNYARNARVEVENTKISFEEIIKESIQINKFLPGFEAIQIETKIDVHDYVGDALRIKILINSLISNSLIHHDLEKSNPWVKIHIYTTDKQLLIEVSDNGLGIEPSVEPRIFDMFYKGTNASPGSGLGLYIVKRVLKKLGGEITVKTQPEVGSTFTILLPYPNRKPI